MLENINLKKKLAREEYKLILPGLQQRLYDLEKACWDNGVPTVIVFEGWDAAGKGTTIAALTQRLDPRGFRMYPIAAARTSEQQRPWLWRFWLKVPNRGEMAIFDHSWYARVLEDRVEKTIPEKAWREAYRDIVEFERMLADDGAAILKFFLHISRKEQTARFKARLQNPEKHWKLEESDFKDRKLWPKFMSAYDEVLSRTSTAQAPWYIIPADHKWYRDLAVAGIVLDALRQMWPRIPKPKLDPGRFKL